MKITRHELQFNNARPGKNSLLLCSVAVCACVVFYDAAPAMAQDASKPSATGSYGIEEVVVTARRRAEAAQATPISISAVTGDELKNRTVVDVSDLAQIVPGLSLNQSVSDAFSVVWQLRAQSTSDLNSVNDPPVSIYSDGVFLNSLAGVLSASVVDLERIEVLKGPQGTLYGRNTTGGGINIYTKQPVDRWEGQLTAGAGNHGSYTASGVFNAPLGGGSAIRLVAEAMGHSGYGLNVTTGQKTGDRRSIMTRGAIKLIPSDNLTITLRGDFSRLNSDNGPVSIPLAITPGSAAAIDVAVALGVSPGQAVDYYNSFVNLDGSQFKAAYNADNFAKVRTYGASATVEYNMGGPTLKSITAYRNARTDRATDTDAIPIDLFWLNSFVTKIHQFTEELQLSGDLANNRLHYTLGGFYLDFNGHDINASTAVPSLSVLQPTRTDGDVTTKSIAGFGQVIYDITPIVHFTGGLRYTDEKKTLVSKNNIGPAHICNVPPPAGIGGEPCVGTFGIHEHNLSYTAGFDWNITNDVMVYAKTSRGFKSGGVNEKLSANPISVAPYQAERLTDYETGVKSDWLQRRLRVNATYYHSVYDNDQQTVVVLVPPFNAVSVVQNAASATVDGVEVEATALPTRNLRLQGSLAYTLPKYQSFIDPTTGVDHSDRKFNQVSKWTYTLSGTYTVPTSFGSAQLELDWAYKGPRNLFPTAATPSIDNQPGFGIMNGQIRVLVDDQSIDARFYVKNLFNKKYIQSLFDLTPALGLVTGYPGEPRMFGFNVTKNF